MMTQVSSRPARRLSGAVAAELAMVSPFLTLVLFGFVELAVVARDYHGLACAARAGVAAAARGATVEEITDHARVAGGSLRADDMTVMASYRVYRTRSQSWSAWSAVRNSGNNAGNSCPAHCQVRCTVTAPHTLVMPAFFSVFATEPDGETVMLNSEAVATRE